MTREEELAQWLIDYFGLRKYADVEAEAARLRAEVAQLREHRPRNILETVAEWNKKCKDRAMRVNY